MKLVLALDSATKNCSVALIKNGEIITWHEEYSESFSHAEKLTLFINQVLDSSSFSLQDLDAIVVDKGPGSYTGLRIGVSVAKGLAYALNIPLLSMHSLEILFWQAIKKYPDFEYYIPMIDARRMEVYTSIFNPRGEVILPVNAQVIDENSFADFAEKKVLFFGDGACKCQNVLNQIAFANFDCDIHPSALGMNTTIEQKIIEKDFEDTAYFEPYYLKDFIAGKPKKML